MIKSFLLVHTIQHREEIEKQKAKANYMKLHLAGKTDQAKADLARLAIIRREREEAAKKKESEKKGNSVFKINISMNYCHYHLINFYFRKIDGLIMVFKINIASPEVDSHICLSPAAKEAAAAAAAASRGLHSLSLK